MEMIGIYAAPTTTANNVAQLQVPRKGRIRGIQFTLSADLDADLESAFVELSRVPFFQTTTNNTRNLVFSAVVSANLTTSGAVQNMVQGFYPMDITVEAGEILYVNATLVGTTVCYFTALIHFA